MFRLAVHREPSSAERARFREANERLLRLGQDEATRWFHLAGVMLNLDETISIE